MANTFIALAVPVTSGVGAATDVSGLGSKTVLVEGVPPGIGPFAGALIIEGSQDNEASFLPFDSINLAVDPPKITIETALTHVRVRRANVAIGTPAPVVTLGAENVAGNAYASLPVTPGNGTGAAVNTSAHPPNHTVLVSGQYRGDIVIEGSMEAAGENFDVVAEILTQGLGRVIFSGPYSRMRVRREDVGLSPGLPIVTVGSLGARGAPLGTLFPGLLKFSGRILGPGAPTIFVLPDIGTGTIATATFIPGVSGYRMANPHRIKKLSFNVLSNGLSVPADVGFGFDDTFGVGGYLVTIPPGATGLFFTDPLPVTGVAYSDGTRFWIGVAVSVAPMGQLIEIEGMVETTVFP